jgi:hypothetical protein
MKEKEKLVKRAMEICYHNPCHYPNVQPHWKSSDRCHVDLGHTIDSFDIPFMMYTTNLTEFRRSAISFRPRTCYPRP